MSVKPPCTVCGWTDVTALDRFNPDVTTRYLAGGRTYNTRAEAEAGLCEQRSAS